MKSLKLKLSIATISVIAGSLLTSNAAVQLSDDAELFFTGSAALEYEDNLFRTTVNEVNDIAFIITPGVELIYNDKAAFSASASYKHEFKYFDDNSELDENYAHLNLRAKYDSGIFMGSASAAYDELSSNTFDINNVADRVDRDVSKISLLGKYDISDLTAVSVGLDLDETDFAPTNFFDHDSVAVPVTVYYTIRPKVDLTAGFRYRDVNVENSPDYSDQFYFLGAEGELFSPKVRAELQFGFQERDGDVAASDFSTATYNAKVIYLASAKNNYFLSLNRDFRTASTTGGSIVNTIGTVGGNFGLSQTVSLIASLSAGRSDYEQSAREEDLLFLTLGGSYSPNDYLKLSVNYQYQDVDGNGLAGASDYSNNKVIFSASVRY